MLLHYWYFCLLLFCSSSMHRLLAVHVSSHHAWQEGGGKFKKISSVKWCSYTLKVSKYQRDPTESEKDRAWRNGSAKVCSKKGRVARGVNERARMRDQHPSIDRRLLQQFWRCHQHFGYTILERTHAVHILSQWSELQRFWPCRRHMWRFQEWYIAWCACNSWHAENATMLGNQRVRMSDQNVKSSLITLIPIHQMTSQEKI